MWDKIGGILGGMGQFAAGVGGFFGGDGNQGFDAHDNYKMSVRRALYTPTYMRQGMEAAGYHPLAALGINPGSGGSARPVGRSGSSMANMGQGLERMLAGQSEEQKARTRLLNAEAAAKEKEISGDPQGQKDQVEIIPALQTSEGRPGESAAVGPMTEGAWDKQGYFWDTLEAKKSEPLESDWFNKVRYGIIQGLNWGRSVSNLAFNMDRDWYNKILRERPRAPQGYHVVYDALRGQYKRIPLKERRFQGEDRVFLHNKLEIARRRKFPRGQLYKSHGIPNVLKKSH